MEYVEQRKFLGVLPLPDKRIKEGREIKGRRGPLPFLSRRSVRLRNGLLELSESKTGPSDPDTTYSRDANIWRRFTRITIKPKAA